MPSKALVRKGAMSTASHNLDAAIEATRKAYLALVHKVYAAAPSAETVPALISYAEEFGPAMACKALRDEPRRFGAGAPSGTIPQALERDLTHLVTLGDELDRLVGSRESLLAKAQPGRAREFAFQGRDASLAGTVGLTVELVEPRGVPEPARLGALERDHAPEQSPTRKRRRERER